MAPLPRAELGAAKGQAVATNASPFCKGVARREHVGIVVETRQYVRRRMSTEMVIEHEPEIGFEVVNRVAIVTLTARAL